MNEQEFGFDYTQSIDSLIDELKKNRKEQKYHLDEIEAYNKSLEHIDVYNKFYYDEDWDFSRIDNHINQQSEEAELEVIHTSKEISKHLAELNHLKLMEELIETKIYLRFDIKLY